MDPKKAFTLIELMLVVVLFTIIAGFALPSFNTAVQKGLENDAATSLTMIHGALQIYRARYNSYPDTGGALLAGDGARDFLNTNLGLNLFSKESMTYDYLYQSPAGGVPGTFEAAVTFDTGSDTILVILSSAAIGDYNPCCDSANPGICKILNDCLL